MLPFPSLLISYQLWFFVIVRIGWNINVKQVGKTMELVWVIPSVIFLRDHTTMLACHQALLDYWTPETRIMISDQHLPWEILRSLLQQSGIYHLYAVLHIIIPSLRGIITQNQNILIIFSVIDGIAIQNTHNVRLTIADECLVAGWSMFSRTITSNFQYFSKFHNSSSSRSFEEKCWMNHQLKTRCFVELGLR